MIIHIHSMQDVEEPGLVWSLRVVGGAGLVVAKDASYDKSLAALAASWETASAGRAAKVDK